MIALPFFFFLNMFLQSSGFCTFFVVCLDGFSGGFSVDFRVKSRFETEDV